MNQTISKDTLLWGSLFTVTLFVGLTIAVVFYIIEICNEPARKLKREQKNRKKDAKKESKYLSDINLDGMKIVEFARLYEKGLKDDFLFKEFNAVLSRYRIKSICKKALEKVNERKNIFEGHIPFEDNYVDIGPKIRNYINASWVKGVRSEKVFIITQAPMKSTVRDFWKMIWINQCSIIVMIGKDIINDEVIINYLDTTLYPPKNEKRKLFTIEIYKKQLYSEFIKRYINLYFGHESRQIIHLQFITWTHVSVTNAQVILELRRQMNLEWFDHQGPIVVHCISGCGRSGTFVAISNMCDLIDKLKESREDEKISIPYEVMEVRECRMFSVANLHQYSMIYETIIHYIISGVTTIILKDLEIEMQFLSMTSSVTGATRFERQFKNANSRTRKLYLTDCAAGIRQENQSKNRIFNIIPRDYDRPYLKNIIQKNRSDYINAVYVSSFNSKDHFIVTQWPLINTTNDIWRLVFDKNIHTVVLLDVFDYSKSYPAFWPNTKNQAVGCGSIVVKLVKDELIKSYIRCQIYQLTKLTFRLKKADKAILKTKNIKITSKTTDEKWEVTFFHLLNWNNKMPDNLENILDFIYIIEEYNTLRSCLAQTSKPPIVIISKDGVERAGVICVMANCLQTISNCGEIDVYSSVLNVKRNRPELIPNLEEYLLCYELCLAYLLSKKKIQESQIEDYAEYGDNDESEVYEGVDENECLSENVDINENFGSEARFIVNDEK